jgi:hypothetical protein
MPDGWELANGFDPNNSTDASLDADADGMSNLREYRAGTNPNNSSDALRITSAIPSGADIRVTFTTVASRYYRLEKNADLAAGPWTTVADLIQGNGGPLEITDIGAANVGARFYRVRLLP